MIRSILQNVLSQGQSQRRCAQALGISKGVVAKYVAAAQATGLDWPAIEPLAEHELEARLIPARGAAQAEPPEFAAMHRELSRKGVTLMLLWQEYQAEHLGRRTLQYSQFCERYRQYTKTLKRSMRQVHRAGEKLFMDYAGPTLVLDDGSRANIFVSASRNDRRERGVQGLSLRQLAERAELSRQAPYNHFRDKQALLAELASNGFRALESHIRHSKGYPADPASLERAAAAYIAFAQQRLALFRLMFSSELESLRESRRLFG